MTREENDRNWDEYFIEGTNVLKNNLGITDKEELKEKEAEITFKKLVELHENPLDLGYGKEQFKAIHYYLFSDIYPFAGKYRTVYMKKNNSYFAPVEEIDERLNRTFQTMEEESKNITSIYSFATFLTTYYTELLNIHPFREGNGRTTREFIREYANHKSEELAIPTINFSWSNVDQDTINEFIDKSRAFRSAIELEILKALEPKEKEKTY